VDNASAQQTYYQDTSAFGSGAGMGMGGTEASPFKFGGDNGCQTDGDTGLVLMGHRYYDTRIGRFISQDPIGDGDNWYAYCGNDPVDGVDPEGLSESTFSYNSSMSGQAYPGGDDWGDFREGDYGTYNEYGPNGSGDGKLYYCGTLTVGPSTLDIMMQGGMGLNMGHPGMGMGGMGMGGSRMFAASPGGVPDSSLTTPGGQAELGQLSEDGVTVGKPGNPFKSYEQARDAALKWLERFNFKAEKPNFKRFPESERSTPNGMTTADGKTGFRVEYDERSGAHINVESGKIKGPHFSFEGTEKMIEQIIKRFSL
jgi:RHS repeat-associated protein